MGKFSIRLNIRNHSFKERLLRQAYNITTETIEEFWTVHNKYQM